MNEPRSYVSRSTLIGALSCFLLQLVGFCPKALNAEPLFGPNTDFTAGGIDYSLAIGDLNGDGKLDLAVPNVVPTGAGTVSVLLGNGSGTFGLPTKFGVGGWPWYVAIADLNSDEKPDLAVANWASNTVSVLLGNGDGTFGVKTDLVAGASPQTLALGDLNHDGRLDLVVPRGPLGVSVLLGNGDGTFGLKTDFFALGLSTIAIVIRDVNQDGDPDLVMAGAFNSVSVMLGNGKGGFGLKTDYLTGPYPYSVSIRDLNHDNMQDLSVANFGDSTVSILMGNGNGTFGLKMDLVTGYTPNSVVTDDLNGDGQPDLAVSATNNTMSGPRPIVSVFLGSGEGTFGARTDYITGNGGPNFLATGDLNADGRPDIVAANAGAGTVSVLLNTGMSVPVTLLSWSAEASPDEVVLHWRVSEDASRALFHLYREEPGVARIRLSERPLNGKSDYEFHDMSPVTHASYWIEVVERSGEINWLGPFRVDWMPHLVGIFSLAPPSPNPAHERTSVSFTTKNSGSVKLDVFDEQGRLVRQLLDALLPSGNHSMSWDGRLEKGSVAPSGIYHFRMEAAGVVKTQKIVIVR